MAKYLVNTARTLIFSTALPPPAVAAAMAALELLREQPRRVEKLQPQRGRAARGAGRATGFAAGELGDPDRAAGDRATPTRRCRPASGRSSRACSRRRSGPPTVPGGHVAAAARGDGVAHQVRAARGRARARARRCPPRRAAARRTRGRAGAPAVFDGLADARLIAPARPLRHRHRHRRRASPWCRRRLRRARRARRAGGGVQAGGHRAGRAARRLAARPRAARRSRRRGQTPEEVAPLPVRPAGVARTTRPSWPA